MGAMHNDRNRCTFMYADDRRCRNLIHTPEAPFCFYHTRSLRPKRRSREVDDPSARALFDWLTTHTLDNATALNQALNQVFLLVVARRISMRRADSLMRMARLLLQSVPAVRHEFRFPGFRDHLTQSDHFLAEIGALLAASFAEKENEEDPEPCTGPAPSRGDPPAAPLRPPATSPGVGPPPAALQPVPGPVASGLSRQESAAESETGDVKLPLQGQRARRVSGASQSAQSADSNFSWGIL